jgi:hypothetical protein
MNAQHSTDLRARQITSFVAGFNGVFSLTVLTLKKLLVFAQKNAGLTLHLGTH